MTTTTTRLATLAIAGALLLAGCSSQTDEPQATDAPTVEATTPAVEESLEAVVPTEVGTTVPADQVDAVRDAGAAVYVSPTGDGSGVVIDPEAGTPQIVVEDLERAHSGGLTDMDDFDEALAEEVDIARAAEAAGTGVFILTIAPSFASDGSITDTMYVVDMLGEVEGHERGHDYRRDSKADAVAAVQHLIDRNPHLELIDLT